MKRPVALALACLALLGAALAGYLLVFRGADTPAAPAPAPAARPPDAAPAGPDAAPALSFAIAGVEGTVEVRRGGVWTQVMAGDRLAAADAIRTGDAGRATLRAAGGDELVLRERVELAVERLGATVTELTLLRGRVKAAAAAGTERLQISSAGAQAVGAGGGRFTVYADTRGAVAIASESGDVRVIAAGTEVVVGAGTQSYVPPGQAPTGPVPIPEAVFLSVAWPGGEVATAKATVRGKAAPGTEITVAGQPAVVKDDGSFETQVALREGANRIEVLAETVDGRTRTSAGRIQVNTKGPPLEADPSNLFDPPDAGGRRPRDSP